MNEAQINGFIQVVECGSISTAAKRLFISAQALHQQVNSLEKEVGTPLLVRSRSGCVTTLAGQVFYEGALRIRDELADLVDHTRHAAGRDATVICVASRGLVNDHLYIDALASFSAVHPEVAISMEGASHADRGAYDVITGDVDFSPADYSLINSVTSHCFVVAARTNEVVTFASQDGLLSLEDLRGATIIATCGTLSWGVLPSGLREAIAQGTLRIEEVPGGMVGGVDSRLISDGCVQLCLGPRRIDSKSLVQMQLRDTVFEYGVYRSATNPRAIVDEFGTWLAHQYNTEWEGLCHQVARSVGFGR